MKRIQLLIILFGIGSLCLNAQEKRQTKTITGTSYEDLSAGFADIYGSYLSIREGDKITYSYYLKDGKEVLDGPFTYTTQSKPKKEIIEGHGFQRYHYKYPSPVIERKETVKGSFSNGKCNGQWTWVTTTTDESNNYLYWSYVGKMTRCYKDGRPDGQWSLTLDMKAREGTGHKKASGTLDGTFILGSFLPDKKIYHYAYAASFQDGKLSMKTDEDEIVNGKKVIEYIGGITFSDEDITYIAEHENDRFIYFYKDSLRYDVRCSDDAGEFTKLPLFREDVRIGGYDRSDYFGFVDSQYLGSSLFFPAWDWGEHADVSKYCCDPYVWFRSVEKIKPLDRKEASRYLNEKQLTYFQEHYVLNYPMSKDDYEWVVSVADSLEREIKLERELFYARHDAMNKIDRYNHYVYKLNTLSLSSLPDNLAPKCEFLVEHSISQEFYDTKTELERKINVSRKPAEIDSLANCIVPAHEKAERFNSRYERYNDEILPRLQKEFPKISPTYVIDKKSKKTVGLKYTGQPTNLQYTIIAMDGKTRLKNLFCRKVTNWSIRFSGNPFYISETISRKPILKPLPTTMKPTTPS